MRRAAVSALVYAAVSVVRVSGACVIICVHMMCLCMHVPECAWGVNECELRAAVRGKARGNL